MLIQDGDVVRIRNPFTNSKAVYIEGSFLSVVTGKSINTNGAVIESCQEELSEELLKAWSDEARAKALERRRARRAAQGTGERGPKETTWSPQEGIRKVPIPDQVQRNMNVLGKANPNIRLTSVEGTSFERGGVRFTTSEDADPRFQSRREVTFRDVLKHIPEEHLKKMRLGEVVVVGPNKLSETFLKTVDRSKYSQADWEIFVNMSKAINGMADANTNKIYLNQNFKAHTLAHELGHALNSPYDISRKFKKAAMKNKGQLSKHLSYAFEFQYPDSALPSETWAECYRIAQCGQDGGASAFKTKHPKLYAAYEKELARRLK